MKSILIAAALCAALCASIPATAQAATTKLTDHDIYCSFIALTSKCNPAKPVVAPVKAAPKIAMVKPVAVKPAMTAMKVMACVKRTDGKPFLLSCSWK